MDQDAPLPTDSVTTGTPPLTPPASLPTDEDVSLSPNEDDSRSLAQDVDEDDHIPDAQHDSEEDDQNYVSSSSDEEMSDLDGSRSEFNFKMFSDQTPFGYNQIPTDPFDRLSDLPDETLLDIFTIARIPGGMRGSPSSFCAPLSKRLLRITQQTLYSTVQLGVDGEQNLDILYTFLQTITDNPDLANLVLDLTLFGATARLGRVLQEKILHQLPNLRRLRAPRGIEMDSITSFRGVSNPAWLVLPHPALRHLDLLSPRRQFNSKVLDFLDHQPSLVSLRIPLSIHATKRPQRALADATADIATSFLPTNIKRLKMEIRFYVIPSLKHPFNKALARPIRRLLAHALDLHLVDHESDNVCFQSDFPDQFVPPLHHALLATNPLLASLDVTTAHPALDRTDDDDDSDDGDDYIRVEGFYIPQGTRNDLKSSRSRFALNTILTRFPLLTSLTLNGAAVDDRDLSFLISLPLLQRLSFGALFDLRLGNMVELIESRAYPTALRELAVFVNRPFTTRPMWTIRRNPVDAKRLLEAVEGTRVRIGGDLRDAVSFQEWWDELESDSDDATETGDSEAEGGDVEEESD